MKASGSRIEISMTNKEITNIKEHAVLQALETIRNRIDEFGVSEPTIQKQSESQILVQLPGIKDIERAKKLIGRTALLEFKIVDDESDLSKALKGEMPQGDIIAYEKRRIKRAARQRRLHFFEG